MRFGKFIERLAIRAMRLAIRAIRDSINPVPTRTGTVLYANLRRRQPPHLPSGPLTARNRRRWRRPNTLPRMSLPATGARDSRPGPEAAVQVREAS